MIWVAIGVLAVVLGVCAWADRSRRRRGLIGGINPRGAPAMDTEAWTANGGIGATDGGGGGS
jgi:hypothetical protein